MASLVIVREAGDGWIGSLTLDRLGHLALEQGDPARAFAYARESLALALEFRDTRNCSYALETLAAVAAVEGQPKRAARLFGAAHALREPIGDVMPASRRPVRERDIRAIRLRLGEAAFGGAWAEGRTMSLDQAAAYAVATAAQPTGGLTLRQVEVLQLVAGGKSNREIADVLVLSHRTVKRNLDNIFARLGVSSRAAATAAAVRAGVV